ncbi:BMC domain-containing protein [Propionibacterium australiense]|uniref:BMC domain n=1 Tax=Propionibacterium australiense TaxID=119981 RepID=A0A383S850_9ACTN|nr:BMC domain-containing protein [Propionibacterium australiense]RLP10945.1 BMC domain-containing protein [Propionibacterium australiense]RLP13088.1 BMC domain-containing protein [Propionibacterium australiense]SYZ33901.1 BMC domain [Propionibacterium australiense]VEH90918.1 Carbon dioxide-concentrating mechanism protein CcmK homolog 2 [Propionibacterium australiense]
MLTNALGEIEVLGLPAAIEAADVAVKAADVRLIGYETTDGAGMVTVKIEGQVSSVQSAIAAARAAAARVSTVFAVSVIPRPNPQLGGVVLSPATVGLGAPTSVDQAAKQAAKSKQAAGPEPAAESTPPAGPEPAAEPEQAAETGQAPSEQAAEHEVAADVKKSPAAAGKDGARRTSSRSSSQRKTSAGDDKPQAEKK